MLSGIYIEFSSYVQINFECKNKNVVNFVVAEECFQIILKESTFW